MKRALSESDALSCCTSTYPRSPKRCRVPLPTEIDNAQCQRHINSCCIKCCPTPLSSHSQPLDVPNAYTRPELGYKACERSILNWSSTLAGAEPPQEQPAHGDTDSEPAHTYDMADSRRGGRADSQIRRGNKLRKRSCSPNKQPTEYREIYMKEAGIFVDHCYDLPPDVASLVARVLGDEGTETNVAVPDKQKCWMERLAVDYRDSCWSLAKNTAGEGGWRSELLSGVVQKLARLDGWEGILKVSGSQKPWRAALKPVRATQKKPPYPTPTLPPPSAPTYHMLSTALPGPKSSPAIDLNRSLSADSFTSMRDIDHTITSAYPFHNIVLSPSTDASETASIATTSVATADDDPTALTNPKPDISVGITHASFTTNHQRLLDDVNQNQSLLSEPFSARTGLHFPFLVVEAKGLGSMVSAQNQAAVDAASALNILGALRNLV